jgi:hypothetical protein
LKAEIARLKRRNIVSNSNGSLGRDDCNRHRGRRTYHTTNDWATTRPTDGSLTKIVGGKIYHRCKGHAGRNHSPNWVIHKSSECTNQKKAASNNRDNGDATQSNDATRLTKIKISIKLGILESLANLRYNMYDVPIGFVVGLHDS